MSNSNEIEWKVGQTYVTNLGYKMVCISTTIKDINFPIVGIVTNRDKKEFVGQWSVTGEHYVSDINDIKGPWVEPKRTKIVYKWLVRGGTGNWYLIDTLLTEAEADHYGERKKTGRKFEVEE